MTRAVTASPRRAGPLQVTPEELRHREGAPDRDAASRRWPHDLRSRRRAGSSAGRFVAGRATGTAVRRNRAKRRLREALRRVPLGEGRDYVVIADGSVVDAPFETVVSWARTALGEE